MTPSQKQIMANHRNAMLSTGPRTEAGKVVSRLNSTKHGLAGQLLVMRSDHDEAYAAYYADMLPELAPAGMIELDLARRIICDSWRLNRAAAFDVNLIENGRQENPGSITYESNGEDHTLAEARAFRTNAPTFQLLSLYEQRLQRSFQKNLALLRAMQKERRAEALKALQTAKSALRPAPQPTEIPAPMPNGSAQAASRAAVVRDSNNGFVCASPAAAASSPPSAPENAPSNMAA